jgi:hypothetical protein
MVQTERLFGASDDDHVECEWEPSDGPEWYGSE